MGVLGWGKPFLLTGPSNTTWSSFFAKATKDDPSQTTGSQKKPLSTLLVSEGVVLFMYYENPDGVSVHGGFPNPATDASLQGIDLNKLLIKNSAATYLMRIAGNDWRMQGIFAGDIVIIDRAVRARTNDLVIWWYDGSFAISVRHKVPLDCEIWGVVTTAIHQYRGEHE